jgi:hypothetical protein
MVAAKEDPPPTGLPFRSTLPQLNESKTEVRRRALVLSGELEQGKERLQVDSVCTIYVETVFMLFHTASIF